KKVSVEIKEINEMDTAEVQYDKGSNTFILAPLKGIEKGNDEELEIELIIQGDYFRGSEEITLQRKVNVTNKIEEKNHAYSFDSDLSEDEDAESNSEVTIHQIVDEKCQINSIIEEVASGEETE